MQMNRPSKWKVLLVALVFSGAFVLAEARKAHAFVDPLTAYVTVYAVGFVAIVAVVATFAAVKTTVCTPVAAIKASDHPEGFGGAFKDCWDWSRDSQPPATMGMGGSE